MRAGAETKGRVAIALAIGFCVTAMSAQRTRHARPSSESREATVPVILSIEDDRASTQGDLQVLLGALRGPTRRQSQSARSAGSNVATSSPISCHISPRTTPARPQRPLALGLALRGPALDGVPHGQQEGAGVSALLAAGEITAPRSPLWVSITSAVHVGRLPYRGRRIVQEPWRRSFARCSRSPFLRSGMPRTSAPREGSNRWRV